VKLVENGMQVMEEKPAELMVSKAMNFVDKTQINSAEMIAKSMELADKVKENPTDAMLNMIVNVVANQILEGPNALQLAHATAQKSEAMHNGTPLLSDSILSTAIGLVNTGLQE